jgi:hypothetical protein
MLSKYLLDSVPFYGASPMSNVWNGSTAQTWCADFCSENFNAREENGILLTTKTEAASGSWGDCELSNDKVFFLSALEATDEAYGFLSNDTASDENRVGIVVGDTDADHWWLRSPNTANSYSGGMVYPAGNMGIEDVAWNAGARPAFNLDLNAVLFTSAAVNGKLSGTFDSDSLPAIITAGTSNWKLTVYDAGQTLTIDTVTRDEDEVTISYSSAATGTNQYVSAIITNGAGTELLRYGKLKAAPDASAASGTASLILPDGFDANGWVLKIFSEQCNADYRTDYAGTLHTVSVPTTPPSSDARLNSVFDMKVSTDESHAGTAAEPKEVFVAVESSVASVSAGDLEAVNSGATIVFYGTDSTFEEEGDDGLEIELAAGSDTDIYIKTISQDGTNILYYKVTIYRYDMNAMLGTVLGREISADDAHSGTMYEPKEAIIEVPYAVAAVSGEDIEAVDEGAEAIFYGTDSEYVVEMTGDLELETGVNEVYIKVVAEDGTTTLYYEVTIMRAAPNATEGMSMIVKQILSNRITIRPFSIFVFFIIQPLPFVKKPRTIGQSCPCISSYHNYKKAL